MDEAQVFSHKNSSFFGRLNLAQDRGAVTSLRPNRPHWYHPSDLHGQPRRCPLSACSAVSGLLLHSIVGEIMEICKGVVPVALQITLGRADHGHGRGLGRP